MPRLSIIIPAYNAESYLPKCLDSIFSQDFSDYEVLCIDDGSTDGTPALLEQYATQRPNLHILKQPNQGMATARNLGLDNATGDYILFIDSDDWLCDGALSTLAAALTGEDIVGFNAQKYHEPDGQNSFQPSVTESESATGWDYFNRHRLTPTDIHFVCIWQRAYRREFLNDSHLRFADGLRRGEDDLFSTLAMLRAASVKTITDCLYTYRVRQGSITRTDDPRLTDDSRRVQHLLAETFVPLEGIDKQVIYQVLASNYINSLTKSHNSLSDNEWRYFKEVCVTPRHRRLYRLARIHPILLRTYISILHIISN